MKSTASRILVIFGLWGCWDVVGLGLFLARHIHPPPHEICMPNTYVCPARAPAR